MSKCTKGGEEIKWLKHYQSGQKRYELICIDGAIKYGDEEFLPDDKVCDYDCPLCGTTLFTDELKAIAFLRGDETISGTVDVEIETCGSNIVELWGEPMNGDEVGETVEKFKKRLAQVMGDVE